MHIYIFLFLGWGLSAWVTWSHERREGRSQEAHRATNLKSRYNCFHCLQSNALLYTMSNCLYARWLFHFHNNFIYCLEMFLLPPSMIEMIIQNCSCLPIFAGAGDSIDQSENLKVQSVKLSSSDGTVEVAKDARTPRCVGPSLTCMQVILDGATALSSSKP